MFSSKQRFRWWFDNAIEWWPDILGAIMLVIGFVVFLSQHFGWSTLHIPVLSDFFLRIWPEMIGIGLAVILIDNANEMLRTREEKKRLILQMGSPDNPFAIEALRQLSERGWLTDGSLRGANLEEANLKEANLRRVYPVRKFLEGDHLDGAFMMTIHVEVADLRWTNLMRANLQGAKLQGANLQEAILIEANLERVNLEKANHEKALLMGANLEGAKVRPEQLEKAYSIDGAILPDGTKYKAKDLEEKQEE